MRPPRLDAIKPNSLPAHDLQGASGRLAPVGRALAVWVDAVATETSTRVIQTMFSRERAFETRDIRWLRLVEMLPGYTVRSLGAYWTIHRALFLLVGGVR